MKIEKYAFLKEQYFLSKEKVPLLELTNIFQYNAFISRSIKRVKGFTYLTDAYHLGFTSEEVKQKECFIYKDETGKFIEEGVLNEIGAVVLTDIVYDGKTYEVVSSTVTVDIFCKVLAKVTFDFKYGDLAKESSPLHFKSEYWVSLIDSDLIKTRSEYNREDPKLTQLPWVSFVLNPLNGNTSYVQYLPVSVLVDMGLTGIASLAHNKPEPNEYSFRSRSFKPLFEFKP